MNLTGLSQNDNMFKLTVILNMVLRFFFEFLQYDLVILIKLVEAKDSGVL